VATFLTLRAPEPRDAQPLWARLLDDRAGRALDGPLHGAPVVLGSQLAAGFGGVVQLDVDPRSLPAHTAVRYDLHPRPEELVDALAVELLAPRVVFTGVGVQRAIDAGHGVGLDADVDAGQAADFLSLLAHTEVGFVARAADAAGVLQVVAATIAALRGDDVRTAWDAPELATLLAIPDPAARALREVLRSIEVPDAVDVAAALTEAGVGRARR